MKYDVSSNWCLKEKYSWSWVHFFLGAPLLKSLGKAGVSAQDSTLKYTEILRLPPSERTFQT